MSIIEFLQEICIKNPMNTQSIERKEAEKKERRKNVKFQQIWNKSNNNLSFSMRN